MYMNNLTNQELILMSSSMNLDNVGALLADRLDALMHDDSKILRTKKEVGLLVDEAIGCYPKEDFLDKILSMASELEKNTRGANKQLASKLVAWIDDISTNMMQQSEHGIHELKKIFEISQTY